MKYFLLLLLITGSFISSAQTSSQRAIDSMLAEIPNTKTDTGKAHLYDRISYIYSNIDPQAGIKYGEQARKIAEDAGWDEGIASANTSLGINYVSLSEYTKALDHYEQAIKQYHKTGDKNREAGVLANIALVYMNQSNYPKALEYNLKALTIKEDYGDKRNAALIQTNIGTIYLEQKKYEEAMRYYSSSLKTYEELKDADGMARALGNIGIVYSAKENYGKALEYHLEALRTYEQTGNKYSIQVNLANLGLVYTHLHDIPKALAYHQKALQLSTELGDKRSIAVNMGNIGSTYYLAAQNAINKVRTDKPLSGNKTGHLKLAVEYLEKAVALCREINYLGPLSEFSKSLSDAYLLEGDSKRALELYKQYISIRDSVFSAQNNLHLTDLETKRALEIRDRDLLIKEKQLQINKLQLAQKRNERIIFIISISLLLLVLGVMLKILDTYVRSNMLLTREKNRHVLLIEAQVEKIKKQTDVLEEIAHIQSHDVRGPVATILGLLQLFNFDDPTDPHNKAVIEGIATIAEELDHAVKDVINKKNDLSNDTEAV